MFWAFFDPHATRGNDGPGSPVYQNTLPRDTKHSLPRTEKQLLFLLEESDKVEFDNKPGVLN